MAERRTNRSGPGAGRRPGQRSVPRRAAELSTPGGGSGAAPAARRPRFTGRAAILVLVVAVLTVSYASSMRAYLQQRAHITDLKSQIAAKEASIDDLEREKRRWHDPAYVQAQARERFGYLMPGETSYVVLGEDGKPLEGESELPTPSAALKPVKPAWFDTAWDSVVLAGTPPKVQAPAATDIEAPSAQEPGESDQ